MDKCDVLIVGAGPTGLMMAAELVRYGLRCRLIDKVQGPSDKSKALAIQPRTLEIFHFLGIESKFLERGQTIEALTIHSERDTIGRIEFNPLDSPYPFILSLPQSETEKILADYLMNLGLEIERETELVALNETDSGVIATIQTPSHKTQVQAKWVIGCDGAHSFVRKHLNLTFKGKAFPDVFSLADVQIDWAHPHDEVFAFWSPEGILAVIPLPKKGHYRLIFELERCQIQNQKLSEDNLQVDIPPPTFEEVKNVVWKRADPKAVLSNPVWLANFHVNSRLASRYKKGRFFLAGDAVHIHSPIGGQGMNTGLQDAFNLAWKIALVHQGKAMPGLLESYHVERHEVATKLLKGTEKATRMAALKSPWAISLRNTIASFLIQNRSVQSHLIRALTQISLTYSSSSIFYEKGKFKRGPHVGSRLPNINLKEGERNIQLHDLLVKIDSFFIIFFLGDSDQVIDLKLNQLPIKPILIAKKASTQSHYPLFVDPDGKGHEAFGVQSKACYVVRPDTYIGYRQASLDLKPLIDYLNKYSLCKESII